VLFGFGRGFKQIADKCGAILMCDVAQISDLIAAKVILANLYIASV
jgi:glycine/serine hydroxymethyltransferase